MAAGKMMLAARAGRPRRRRTAKTVRKIAKGVVMRLAETRTSQISWLGSLGSNGLLLQTYSTITKGDNQENRDGDRIRAMGVRIRGFLSIDPAVITANQDGVVCRMVVFSSKLPTATITSTGLTYNNAPDPEKLNIISDRFVTFRQDGRCAILNKYFKFPRIVQYDGSSVTKGEFYIALIPVQNVGTGLTASTGLYVNAYVQPYWKDM